MATYTINLNERTSAGKALLGYLISLGVIDRAKDENSTKKLFLKELQAAGSEAKKLARSQAKKRTLDDVIAEL